MNAMKGMNHFGQDTFKSNFSLSVIVQVSEVIGVFLVFVKSHTMFWNQQKVRCGFSKGSDTFRSKEWEKENRSICKK